MEAQKYAIAQHHQTVEGRNAEQHAEAPQAGILRQISAKAAVPATAVLFARPPHTHMRQRSFTRQAGGEARRVGAVRPYQRLLNRAKPKRGLQRRNRSRKNPSPILADEFPEPTDKVFPGSYLKLFNRILDKHGMKLDRDGNPRTAYSLRHTYIYLRLMEGADIYQIAKNCRTSVEMIEKFYAAHIKNKLDASAINVMRPRPATGGKGAANGAIGQVTSKAPTLKLTSTEKFARKERARQAARIVPDDLTDPEL